MVTLSTLRKRARARGYLVSRVPERSRWFAQYGPLVVLDETNRAVLASGLDEAQVEEFLR